MARKVLIVDDERNIVNIIAFNLKKEGYEVVTASDGEEGLKAVFENDPDIILLDIMMPKMDGYEVCKKVREKLDTPIIMLTARAEEVDKVLGLELGADDYVTKPFGIREMMARVKANLRRRESLERNMKQKEQKTENKKNSISFGNLELDFDLYEVRKNDTKIDLTCREFELLKFLAQQKNQVFTREALLEKVWGYEYFGDLRTVDVTVRRLREKIEDDSSSPSYVLTKRGVGYYFGG